MVLVDENNIILNALSQKIFKDRKVWTKLEYLYPPSKPNTKDIANKEIEKILISELKHTDNSLLEKRIIDILIERGSTDVNEIIQTYVERHSNDVIIYGVYLTLNGFEFFKSNLNFISKIRDTHQIPTTEFDLLKKELKALIGSNFEPSQQLEASDLVDKM